MNFTGSKLQLRGGSFEKFLEWDIDITNVISAAGLTDLKENAEPPTREAVAAKWPNASDEHVERFFDAMRQFQHESTRMFYLVVPTVTIEGGWKQLDSEFIQENFVAGAVRDGAGFLQWVYGFYDIKSDKMQATLRADLAKFTLPIGISQQQLLKTLLDALSVWCKIGDNDKYDTTKLTDYYETMRDKMPSTPSDSPMARIRTRLVDYLFDKSSRLLDVRTLITELVEYSKVLGVPEGAQVRSTTNTVLATAGRYDAKDNDCTKCDLWSCRAKDEIKKCVVFNTMGL